MDGGTRRVAKREGIRRYILKRRGMERIRLHAASLKTLYLFIATFLCLALCRTRQKSLVTLSARVYHEILFL